MDLCWGGGMLNEWGRVSQTNKSTPNRISSLPLPFPTPSTPRGPTEDAPQPPDARGQEPEPGPAELLEGRADFLDVVRQVVVPAVALLYFCVLCVLSVGMWVGGGMGGEMKT